MTSARRERNRQTGPAANPGSRKTDRRTRRPEGGENSRTEAAGTDGAPPSEPTDGKDRNERFRSRKTRTGREICIRICYICIRTDYPHMSIRQLLARLDRMPMLKILVPFAAGIALADRFTLPLWFAAGAV